MLINVWVLFWLRILTTGQNDIPYIASNSTIRLGIVVLIWVVHACVWNSQYSRCYLYTLQELKIPSRRGFNFHSNMSLSAGLSIRLRLRSRLTLMSNGLWKSVDWLLFLITTASPKLKETLNTFYKLLLKMHKKWLQPLTSKKTFFKFCYVLS